MKCKYCGKWAGLFKSVHPECLEEHKREEERIIKEKEIYEKEFASHVDAYLSGDIELSTLKKIISDAQNDKVWFDEEYVSSILPDCTKLFFERIDLDSLVDDDSTICRLRDIAPLFERYNIVKQFKCVARDLCSKVINKVLDGDISAEDGSIISYYIHTILKDFLLFDGEVTYLPLEEKILLDWVDKNISFNELHISDEMFRSMNDYMDTYNELWVNFVADDPSQKHLAYRMSYSYILYKLRKGEYLDSEYQMSSAKEHIILKRGEKLVWHFEDIVEGFQSKKITRYVGNSVGASIRVAKGLSLRTGTYEGYPIEEDSSTYLGCGDVAITTQALIFYVTHEGGKSVRIPFDKIISLKSTKNGFIVEQEGSIKPMSFSFDNWCEETYYFILKVIQNSVSEVPTSNIPKQSLEVKNNSKEKFVNGYSSRSSTQSLTPKLENSLEYYFIKCAEEFNNARSLWHAYMDSLIIKNGMPTLYVGCVNYMHDHEYDFFKVISEIKELSDEEKTVRLNKEIDFLKKWKFPGTYSVALFTNGGIINICGDAYKMDRIKSYKISSIGGNYIYSIKINRAGIKEVTIPCEDERSNIEMKALLEACINMTFGHTQFNSDGGVEGYLESNIDESILKFEGLSFAHPIKEFVYALNDLAADNKNISLSTINPYKLNVRNICAGYPIEWELCTCDKKFVYYSMMGKTEDIMGYTKSREAYDKLVAYFTSILGEPTEVEDVPIEVHKNSIFKLLREGEYSIETTYDQDDIYAIVELQVYDEDGEKRVGYVDIYIKDYRLANINSQL